MYAELQRWIQAETFKCGRVVSMLETVQQKGGNTKGSTNQTKVANDTGKAEMPNGVLRRLTRYCDSCREVEKDAFEGGYDFEFRGTG